MLDAAIVATRRPSSITRSAATARLIAWAEALGHDEIVRFLTTNLNEEKAANTKLNTVALRKGVNEGLRRCLGSTGGPWSRSARPAPTG